MKLFYNKLFQTYEVDCQLTRDPAEPVLSIDIDFKHSFRHLGLYIPKKSHILWSCAD